MGTLEHIKESGAGKMNRKGNILIVFIAVLLWGIGLGVISGYGQSINLYVKTMNATLICFLGTFLFWRKHFSKYKIKLFLYLCFSNLLTYMLYHHTILEYVWLYVLVFLLSQFRVSEKQLQKIGLIYGLLGGAVLWVANFTDFFKGWDGNSVSMISFFSYTIFSATTYSQKKKALKYIFILYSILYFVWLEVTESRASMLFSIVLLLALLFPEFTKSAIKSDAARRAWLLTPLLIAVFVVVIRNTSFVNGLNLWSVVTFGKTIFNGRDTIWYNGFQKFGAYFLLGCGDLSGNWHNSAVTCLIGTGVVGYLVWIFGINRLYKFARNWLTDPYVYGLSSAFIFVWLQQSVELGLVAAHGHIVPFVLLGILCARINTLRREYNEC
ncbi:MAG: hypothetical protein PHX08_04975 [Lachnospiraceae bacterium]|nr:hypothetical protein [Lachnospiraceae bacterium]